MTTIDTNTICAKCGGIKNYVPECKICECDKNMATSKWIQESKKLREENQ